MNLSAYQRGALKGTMVVSTTFLAGIGIGLYFLHQKHEAELDKLEKDTAIACLDFAAEHYERAISHHKKDAKQVLSKENNVSAVDSDEFQKEIDAMNNYEEPDEDWKAMREEIDCHIAAYKDLVEQVFQKSTECEECLKKLRLEDRTEKNMITESRSDAEESRKSAD